MDRVNRPSDPRAVNSGPRLIRSGQDRTDYLAVDVREAAVHTVVTEGQSGVVDPEEVQEGRVDVVDFGDMGTVCRFVAPLIAFAMGHPAANAAAA